ncbi:MAG: PspC domain-containing protein, partial [Candidatus Magasanikbacteria bacterium]|nr:PspC domain-containing protein [Candidatus Magasanikbacteria bacterium]
YPNEGLIFGVAAGMSHRFALDMRLVRILWVIAFFATGFFPTALIYLVMGVLVPRVDENV